MIALTRPITSLNLPRDAIAKLRKAGYDILKDLESVTAETLARELSVTFEVATHIISLLPGISQTKTFPLPLTQSAASMVKSESAIFLSHYPALDKLLGGGLKQGRILELSGPPGDNKEELALRIVRSVVEDGHDVLFVDCQNMVTPLYMNEIFWNSPCKEYQQHVHFKNIFSLPEFMAFIYTVTSYLIAHPAISLLVINSIAFPFQSSMLGISTRNSLLARVKRILAQSCAARNLTILTTSQLSTKLLNADGKTGSFDTGTKGILIPQLGETYLPSGKTYRIIIVPETRTTGFLRLLSSPMSSNVNGPPQQEPYTSEC